MGENLDGPKGPFSLGLKSMTPCGEKNQMAKIWRENCEGRNGLVTQCGGKTKMDLAVFSLLDSFFLEKFLTQCGGKTLISRWTRLAFISWIKNR